jgi:hypothetical protein
MIYASGLTASAAGQGCVRDAEWAVRSTVRPGLLDAQACSQEDTDVET